MFELTPFVRRNHIAAYDPFKDFDAMERAFFGGNEPMGFKTDIIEKKDSFLLEAELPGFEKGDINVDIDGDYLTISAEHHFEKKDENDGYVRRERRYGKFSRSFDVSAVKTEDITAEYTNGVLKLNLPKKDEKVVTQKKIEIK